MRDAFKTVVGGRSAQSKPDGIYPRGIEILLKKASVDEAFSRTLLKSPLEASQLIGLELEDSEKSILHNTPESTLTAMIRNTTVKRHQLSAFKTMSASIMLAAILATSSIACSGNMQGEGGAGPYPDVSDSEAVEITVSRMAVVQQALEQYKIDHNGNYVSTADWYSGENPLLEYIEHKDTYDFWYTALRYKGVEEGGKVIDYRLESYGPDRQDSGDDIPCPINTERHRW
ncbi:MAG: hypothetical protein R6U89_04945 [Dehalococcoidia bacterium]